jgi:SNF-related kinase/serine kinase
LGPSPAPYNMYKADIFALGVLIFTLVLGRLPFEYAIPTNKHYSLLHTQNYHDFWKMHQSPLDKLLDTDPTSIHDFKTIFQNMTHPNANQRPTIEQIMEC